MSLFEGSCKWPRFDLAKAVSKPRIVKIGKKASNRFAYSVDRAPMAEGTRLRDLSDHIMNLEERFQQLSSDCHQRIGGLTTQLAEVRDVGQKHYESLQIEATTRHE